MMIPTNAAYDLHVRTFKATAYCEEATRRLRDRPKWWEGSLAYLIGAVIGATIGIGLIWIVLFVFSSKAAGAPCSAAPPPGAERPSSLAPGQLHPPAVPGASSLSDGACAPSGPPRAATPVPARGKQYPPRRAVWPAVPGASSLGGCGPDSPTPNRDGRANPIASIRTVEPERSIVSRPSTALWFGQVGQESKGDPLAWNPDEGAAGIVQIRSCVLSDLERLGLNHWTLADRFDVVKSREIWTAYLTHYGQEYARETGRAPTNEVYARIWNGGPHGWRYASTEQYWRDVKAIMEAGT